MVLVVPATAIACGGGTFGACCNASVQTIAIGDASPVGSQVLMASLFAAATVTLWIVLRVGSLQRRTEAGGGGKYIVLNQATSADDDAFNSHGEDLGHASHVNEDPRSPGPRIHLLAAHLVFFTALTVLAVIDLGLVFLPFSPAAHVAQSLLFQLKNAFCVFLLSVLFWKWGGSRPLVLSGAFALVVFGISYALPMAVSRATAASAGSPHIDVILCRNCPFYFFDTMTLFPSVINVVIWILGAILAVRRKMRPAGTMLIVCMLLFHLANMGPGIAIAAGLLPDGVCVGCILQILYAVGQPILLAFTLVRDSRFVLGAPESFVEGGAVDETQPLLDADPGAAASAAGASPSAQSKKKSVAFAAAVERPKVLTENQRIARFLLDNLDESVKVVEFDQVVRERKIGAGGFGEVFKGSLNGEEVAIKRVLDMDERKARTFLREINTMSRLQHPNITILVGVAVSNDDCYLLTEYVQRGSLFDLLHSKKRKVRLSWANVITVLRGTTVGMDYLHSMDPPFLHRDLKSQNLLIGDHWTTK
jgi:hypothetical protein